MTRPLLLLDVDGVLNPFAATSCPDGFTEENIRGFQVRLSPWHQRWLHELHQQFEVVWATAWEAHANHEIAPRLGLPEWPHITFNRGSRAQTWKLPDVVAYVGHRPTVWIDDDLNADAYQWAAAGCRMLVRTEPDVGLTRAHVDQIRHWGLRWRLREAA
jgi:hypothetical protein